MNALAASLPQATHDSDSIREWIAELTDFTPKQIESILTQMEQPQPLSKNGRTQTPVLN